MCVCVCVCVNNMSFAFKNKGAWMWASIPIHLDCFISLSMTFLDIPILFSLFFSVFTKKITLNQFII